MVLFFFVFVFFFTVHFSVYLERLENAISALDAENSLDDLDHYLHVLISFRTLDTSRSSVSFCT